MTRSMICGSKSNLSEPVRGSSISWTQDFPALFAVVCVKNRDAPRKLSLDTCFIGRILNYYEVDHSQFCEIHLFLRPDLFPSHLNLGQISIDRFREVVFDYRGCIGTFNVEDIITECKIIPGEVDCSVETIIQSYKQVNQTQKPLFVVRFHLTEAEEILPLRSSVKKRMARGNMDVLSEKGLNVKEKQLSASKGLKSPNQVARRRITVEERESNILDDAKENISVPDSSFGHSHNSPSNPVPSGSSSKIGKVSRVRRSLVSDLDGPPEKQSRSEAEDNSGSDNKISGFHSRLQVDGEGMDEKSKSTGKRSPSPDGSIRRSTRKNKCTAYLAESTDTDTGTRTRSSKKSDKSLIDKPGNSCQTPSRRTASCDNSDLDVESMEDDPIFNLNSKDERVKTKTPQTRRKSGRTPRKSYREQEDSDYCWSPEFSVPSKGKINTDDSPRRTPRSRRTPSRYKEILPEESNMSLASRTPNKTEKTPSKTPKTSTKTPSKSPKTPKARTPSGNLSKGCYTPSMPVRASAPLTPMSSLEQVRKNLHVSAVPMSLPCREAEYRNIYHFLENKIRDNSGGCMYISGVPGTGKTATVNAVVRSLKQEVEQKKLRDFQYIEVNGLRMTEPRQVFVQVLKSLTGQKCTPQQAQDILAQRFCSGSAKNKTVVLLVDEVDMLRNRRQDVIYNLFDWPSKSNSRFIVLTIANTMDLPERLLKGRVTSRLGLTRLTFQPYSYKQLQEIVMSRIAGSNSFNDDAVELVARKVAACSGDVRRALDICRRASEFVEEGSPVTMPIINKVLSNMMNSANVCSIKACSKLEKLFLQAVVAENERTGVEEATFISVYRQFQSLCALSGVSAINISEAMSLLNRLGTCGLLLIEHSRADINQSIFLNVNADDIHYALSQASSS